MSLVATEAIILHAFDYSETSRILRLATRDVGVISALARGARRSRTRFGTALDLFAQGPAQHGRVDLAADASGVWVAWLEEDRGRQSLWLARYGHDLATEHFRLKAADVTGRGRATGFPRLQLQDGAAWLAWTDVVAGQPRLRGVSVRP